MKINEAIQIKLSNKRELLLAEAARYTQLAKDEALKELTENSGPRPSDYISHRARAKEHLIRAETYKAAAALIQ